MGEMIFKDKEIIQKLNEIDKKISSLVAMFKADRLKAASKSKKCGGKNV